MSSRLKQKPQSENSTSKISNSVLPADHCIFMEVNDFPKEPPYLDSNASLGNMLLVRKETDRVAKERSALVGQFCEVFTLLMDNRNLSAVALSNRSDISAKTIRNYRKEGNPLPSLNHTLALSIGMNLHPDLAEVLLKKAGHNLDDTGQSLYNFYKYLLKYHHMETIDLWNQRLEAAGFDARLPG